MKKEKKSRRMVKGWEMTTGANRKLELRQFVQQGWDRTGR